MPTFINHYSFVLAALVILLIAGFILFRHQPRLTEMIAFAIIAFGIIIAWVTLRPTQTPLMGEAAAMQTQVGAGKPVLIEFQSPY